MGALLLGNPLTKYSIIDGQQRCGAIFQYIANNYKLKESLLDNKNHRKEYVKDRLFKDLEVEDKKAIWSYVFSIRIVKNQVERDSIVDMFLRLNSNNLTLNPQELRNAEFIGEFMKVYEYLSGLKFWDDNKLFGIADRRRMRDISFVSTLLVFLKEGIEGDISNESLNRIYDLYNDEYPDKENDISIFKSIIKDIGRIIDNKNERIKILKRTVHFYSLFTVLYELTITDELLSDFHIKNYRNFIDNYNNDELLDKYYPNSIYEIFSYKALVKEGTRQKFNRTQRHNNLLKIMKYDADI